MIPAHGGFWTYAFKPNIPEVLFMQTSYAATVTKIEGLLVDDGLSMDFAKHSIGYFWEVRSAMRIRTQLRVEPNYGMNLLEHPPHHVVSVFSWWKWIVLTMDAFLLFRSSRLMQRGRARLHLSNIYPSWAICNIPC